MIPAGCILEVGCGTGTNALWLAAHGFDALGVDVSPLAIDRARAKMGDGASACRFEVLDFLKDRPEAPSTPCLTADAFMSSTRPRSARASRRRWPVCWRQAACG
jgi:SAM-dependent methyltransferase